ncbi:MAG: glycerol kinase GlpK [Planctomycetota bacterium]|nr:glycerol kinase GlpK [Planctomycetota bacterium]MDA1214679.1 glycerol kinase GlpK [Planctomycetota bacterium]
MSPQHVLSLDQGTTSSRAIVFDRQGRVVAQAQQEYPQIYPQPGHVEHDPEAIWSSQLGVARQALKIARLGPGEIAAIGVSNQRETTILWDRDSGKPVANAIVWQSRITTPLCERLTRDGYAETIRQKTGLVIDPYFSGTKIRYLLETQPSLRTQAEQGKILFGTVDSFLMWRLSGGKYHITDVSNASRTMLFNLHQLDWDDDLLKLLDIPRGMLPEVRPTSEIYGVTDPQWFGEAIPVGSLVGDQQAATFGQACFSPGMAKNTYGTGCFLLMSTGDTPVLTDKGLLTTVGWTVNGKTTYCLEGAVFVAGAAVQWLRDGLQFFDRASEIETLAQTVADTDGVYFVPAFVGLGAPYWNPEARGAIFGLTRGTTRGHLARATLEAIAYQTRELLDLMQAEAKAPLKTLKVDGGGTANSLLMQFQADMLDVVVQRPLVQETTALGAAYLAGLAAGVWTDLEDITKNWILDREFTPVMSHVERDKRLSRWKEAVRRSLDWNVEA